MDLLWAKYGSIGVWTLFVGILILVVISTGVLFLMTFVKNRRKGHATLLPNGTQEIQMTVEREYTPRIVVAYKNIPLRLRIYRRETAECSERFILPDYGIDRRLAPYRETVIELTPQDEGEYLFTCARGMYVGTLVIVPRGLHRYLGSRKM